MKYVATELRRRLFVVCSYYFDFRQQGSLTDSKEGLLRSILSSLIEQLPDLCNELRIARNPLSLDLDDLNTATSKILSISNANFVFLVDGLDEYSGNARTMISFLLTFTQFVNLKLCIASRPSTMINVLLGRFPTISVSCHNIRGIVAYLHSTFAEFQPYLDTVDLLNLKNTILRRADGVFLWATFVIEEILQSCIDGAVEAEILEKLDRMPADLGDIYQRSLDCIQSSRKVEAALLLKLLVEANSPDLDDLFCAATFVADTLQIATTLLQIKTREQFANRLQATLGGLVEMNWDWPRIVHETVQSFLKQKRWIERVLPQVFFDEYPNVLWPRVHTNALIKFGKNFEDALYASPNSDASLQDAIQRHRQSRNVPDRLIRDLIVSYGVADSHHAYPYLLISAIRTIFASIKEIESAHEKVPDWSHVLKLKLTGLHHDFSIDTYVERHLRRRLPVSLVTSSIMHLLLAAGHGMFSYIRAHMLDLEALTDFERDDVVFAILLYIPHIRLKYGRCFDKMVDDTTEETMDTIREVTDGILILNGSYTSFHLAVFILLAYDYAPNFIQRLQTTETIHWEIPIRPWWFFEGMKDCCPRQPPLFIWACDNNHFPVHGGVDRISLLVLLTCGVDIGSLTCSGLNIVQYLVGVHMLGHFFVLERIHGGFYRRVRLSSTYRWGCLDTHDSDVSISRAVAKLYMLEEVGANFESVNNYPTPLQMCRTYSERLALAPDYVPEDGCSIRFASLPADRGSETLESSEKAWATSRKFQIALLTSMLKHKHATGHLPRAYQDWHQPEPDEIIYPYFPLSYDHSKASSQPGACYICAYSKEQPSHCNTEEEQSKSGADYELVLQLEGRSVLCPLFNGVPDGFPTSTNVVCSLKQLVWLFSASDMPAAFAAEIEDELTEFTTEAESRSDSPEYDEDDIVEEEFGQRINDEGCGLCDAVQSFTPDEPGSSSIQDMQQSLMPLKADEIWQLATEEIHNIDEDKDSFKDAL